MDTSWIQRVDDAENFLAVYDILLDIKKEMEISRPDKVSIPLLQTYVRFRLLFPADSFGTRDHYCELRWKATEFLKMHRVITDFNLRKIGHRWQNRIAILAEEATVREALSQMHAEYRRRYSTQEDPAAHRQEGQKVFIGHGRSKDWMELDVFLRKRLQLDPDEFNREPVAGLSTKERLEAMLDDAGFAFLVMTAEDGHPDGTAHARENVIHEAGLFQGRLGFERAIILLEDGCAEFSNIHGINHIKFPKGRLKAVSEDIRRVLEREGVMKSVE